MDIVVIDDETDREPDRKRARLSSDPTTDNNNDTWRVILLVDSQEPPRYFEALAGIQNLNCEKRGIPTFDYLWVARRKSDDADNAKEELVLGYGVERKEIHDLADSLNRINKGTKLHRSVEQRFKMDQSGVAHKHFVIQGKLSDIYLPQYRFDRTMKKRIFREIKELETDNSYQVHQFKAARYMEETIGFLKSLHNQVQTEFQQQLLSNDSGLFDHYQLTYRDLAERVAWVTQVGSARPVLGKNALGEKRLAVIFKEFMDAETFLQEYARHGNEAMVDRLANLKTEHGKRILSRDKAQPLCAHLVSGTRMTTKPRVTAAARSSSAAMALHKTKSNAASGPPTVVTPERDNATASPKADGKTAKTALFVDDD